MIFLSVNLSLFLCPSICSSIQWWPLLEHYYFHQFLMVLSQLSLVDCCNVSVGNISLHSHTFILSLILIIQWGFCLTAASAPHRDPNSSSSSLSGMTWRNRTNWDRLNPEELWQRLQDASRNVHAKPNEKLCSSAPRAKAALNAKDAHTKCWFNLANWS